VTSALKERAGVLGWQVPRTWLLAGYIAVILLVPGDYKLSIAGPFDLTPERLVVIALIAAWLLGLVEDRTVWPQPVRVIALPLVAVLVWGFVSLIVNAPELSQRLALATGIKRYFVLLGFLLCFSLSVLLVRTRTEVTKALAAVVTLGSLASWIGILERVAGINLAQQIAALVPMMAFAPVGSQTRGAGVRVIGTASHPIEFGGTMSMLLPLALLLALTAEKPRQRLWYGAACGSIAVAMLFSVSRSSLLAAVLGLAVLFVLSSSRIRLVLAWAAGLGAFAVHMTTPGLLGTFWTILSPSYIYSAETAATSSRLADYPIVWEMLQQRPLFGLSFGGFDPYARFFIDNQYLGLLVTLGIPGALLFLWFLARLLRALWTTARERLGRGDPLPLESALLASISSYALLSALYDTLSFFQVTGLMLVFAAFSGVVLSGTDLTIGAGVKECLESQPA
jgi:O-antigen ligase